MPDVSRLVNAQMSALIDGAFGCLDAAAETINARLGCATGKGTLSRRLSGHAGWPVHHVMALEDAAGRFPVSRMMARRIDGGLRNDDPCLIRQSGLVAKEAGEAVTAALDVASGGAGGGDPAQAVAEIDEAIAALRGLRARLLADD